MVSQQEAGHTKEVKKVPRRKGMASMYTKEAWSHGEPIVGVGLSRTKDQIKSQLKEYFDLGADRVEVEVRVTAHIDGLDGVVYE